MTVDVEQVMTLDELKPILEKKLKAGESVVGLKFRNVKGSVGTILDGLGPHNKLQASMTCIEGGPDHIRERSDWFQCAVSPEKSKTRKSAGVGSGKTMQTADGTRFRLQDILPTDTAEVMAAKAANNLAFEQAKAARDAVAAKTKEEKAALRKAAQETKRAERQAAKDAERAAVLKTSTEKLKEYAASVGVVTH